MSAIDRDALLTHLADLGDPDDAKALAAARAAHAAVAESGTDWPALLAEADAEAADEHFELDDDEDDDAAVPGEADAETDDDEDQEDTPADDAAVAEAKAIIKELLARKNLFDTTRDELKDYQQDIADGALHPADVRYLRALKKRLTK